MNQNNERSYRLAEKKFFKEKSQSKVDKTLNQVKKDLEDILGDMESLSKTKLYKLISIISKIESLNKKQ